MKTSIINGSEVSRLSVAIHTFIFLYGKGNYPTKIDGRYIMVEL